jgi:hypothetical protein
VEYANFAPYLRSNWHDLSVAGDLRAQYAPFDNPPSGAQAFSYIKCACQAGSTPVQLVMRNLTGVACVANWTYALISQDADLYANVSVSDPGLPTTPPVWLNAPWGSNGTVTVQAGAQYSGALSAATPDPTKTLVIRAHLTGAPLRVQSLSPGMAEDY